MPYFFGEAFGWMFRRTSPPATGGIEKCWVVCRASCAARSIAAGEFRASEPVKPYL